MREPDSRSDAVYGLSLVQVMLLLVFAVLLLNSMDDVAVSAPEPPPVVAPPAVEAPASPDADLQARLEAAAQHNARLEKQLGEAASLVDHVKVMLGAKLASREGFQEAIDNLKRGYALCQKTDNTLIEASMQHGVESIRVIGEIPSDLDVDLSKGDETSDLDHIVTFIQDVYQYEKDRQCRFNYRLKYATDNDYRKAREGFEKYFYPEKMMKIATDG
ncbi:MAG TPA: hypothetical protein VFS39_00095 [Nitrospira sp.]|nr:hypothetical protein [Nitrospira sp.]